MIPYVKLTGTLQNSGFRLVKAHVIMVIWIKFLENRLNSPYSNVV